MSRSRGGESGGHSRLLTTYAPLGEGPVQAVAGSGQGVSRWTGAGAGQSQEGFPGERTPEG